MQGPWFCHRAGMAGWLAPVCQRAVCPHTQALELKLTWGHAEWRSCVQESSIYAHIWVEGGLGNENRGGGMCSFLRCSLFLTPTHIYLLILSANCEAWRENGVPSGMQPPGHWCPFYRPWLLEMGKEEHNFFLFVFIVFRKRANLLPRKTLRRAIWRRVAANTCQARWEAREWGQAT